MSGVELTWCAYWNNWCHFKAEERSDLVKQAAQRGNQCEGARGVNSTSVRMRFGVRGQRTFAQAGAVCGEGKGAFAGSLQEHTEEDSGV